MGREQVRCECASSRGPSACIMHVCGLSGRKRAREGRHQVWYVCEGQVLSLESGLCEGQVLSLESGVYVSTCAMTRTKLSTGPPPTRPVKRYEIFSNLHCEISMVLVIESDPASFHPLVVDVSQHAAPKSVNTSWSPLPSAYRFEISASDGLSDSTFER